MRSILLTCVVLLLCAAPAGAVVGGRPIAPETVAWFASGSCGGMLVAPDRILTAAHCGRATRSTASPAGPSAA